MGNIVDLFRNTKFFLGKNAVFEIERYSTAVRIFKRTGLKKLTIGTVESYSPINFRDTDQQFKGYTIDLCDTLSKYLNVEVEYQGYSNASNLIKALQKKEVNFIISSISINAARRLLVDFSTPYFENSLGIMVSNEYKDITNWKALDHPHTRFAVTYGSVYDAITFKALNRATIQKFSGAEEAGQAFLLGRADVLIENRIWINHFVQQNRDKTSILKNVNGKSCPAGIAVYRGDQTLLDTINIFLSQYIGSPVHDASCRRWLVKEVG